MAAEPPAKKQDAGAPAWVMTFADLMSLLMCFFVLLLSFAELDLLKFKQIAGAMKYAFGVQAEVRAVEVPLGSSLIAENFSAGRPTESSVDEVRQSTTDDTKQSLDFTDALNNLEEAQEVAESLDFSDFDKQGEGGESSDAASARAEQAIDQQTIADAEKLMGALEQELSEGKVEIKVEGASIRITISEKASFPSGSATLRGDFLPVIGKIRGALGEVSGRVVVAGHTDNVPIDTARFRSNWELSASRAVTVVHELLKGNVPDARFLVEGHGDANPLVPNTTPENRAINRRVELTIIQGQETSSDRSAAVEELLGQATSQESVKDVVVETEAPVQTATINIETSVTQ